MRKNVIAISIVGMLLLASFMIAPAVVADDGNTIYVDDDNISGPWNGTQEYPYQYIQDAVNAAENADTVFVYNGTYYENVVINKSIALVGENKDSTIINGSSDVNVPEHAVTLNTDYCGVWGFTLIGGDSWTFDSGIWVDSDYNLIDDCKLSYSGGSGLYLNGSHNFILDNVIGENKGYGIVTYYTNISNNTIAGNTIISNEFDGLAFWMWETCARDNSIYHNNFINNLRNNTWDEGNNTWDNGYPSGGNYYSDFDEPSEGAYDNNSDGIVDTPYNISDGKNQDRYPLILPFGENPPVAGFAYIVDETTVSFISSSYDRDGSIDYYWDFGDGKNSTYPNPEHGYSEDYKTYIVNLTVTDNDGKTDTISKSVTTNDTTNPTIKIVKPERAFYMGDKKIRRLFLRMAFVIGDITVEVNASDDSGSGIARVEFYVNGVLKNTTTTSNNSIYSWTWEKDRLIRFIHVQVLKVVAYDNAGHSATTDNMLVRKIL